MKKWPPSGVLKRQWLTVTKHPPDVNDIRTFKIAEELKQHINFSFVYRTIYLF